MIYETIQTVQTSGINWESVSAVVVAVVTCVSLMMTWLSRSIANQITRAIDRLRIEVITKLDRRVTILEQIITGKMHDDGDLHTH